MSYQDIMRALVHTDILIITNQYRKQEKYKLMCSNINLFPNAKREVTALETIKLYPKYVYTLHSEYV